MRRREFFGAVVACVAAALAWRPASAATKGDDNPNLAAIHRHDPSTGRWERVRMRELKPGDRFRIQHYDNDWRAVETPREREGPEVCEIYAEPWPGQAVRPSASAAA